MKEELTEPLCYTKRWLMTEFRVMGELSFSVVNMKYSHMKTTRKRKNHTPGNNNTRQKKKQKMWKLVSRQEEQRRTREAHRQHRSSSLRVNELTEKLFCSLKWKIREREGYLWMPWKVLLAMSTMPPVGRATTPTKPLPMPLKKPAAPSFFAPAETSFKPPSDLFYCGLIVVLLCFYCKTEPLKTQIGSHGGPSTKCHCDFLTNAVVIFMPSTHGALS